MVRGGLLAVLLVVVYVGVTFVQVIRASRHDGARQADAVVVLGAAQYDGRPSPVLQARLDRALELYEAGLSDRIVLTGGRQDGDRFTEATTGYNYLRERGVPDEHLLREVGGSSTFESLAASARFLRDRSLTTVVLVTSDYHAYRVAAVAEEVGLDATVSPISSQGGRAGELRQIGRETLAVAIGRVIGFERLFRLDSAVKTESGCAAHQDRSIGLRSAHSGVV